jgi:hypothetical protein
MAAAPSAEWLAHKASCIRSRNWAGARFGDPTTLRSTVLVSRRGPEGMRRKRARSSQRVARHLAGTLAALWAFQSCDSIS